MEKQLKDYLHLYLGCKGFLIPPDGISYVDPEELTPQELHKCLYNGYSFQPILRPLSDMSMDEFVDFVHIGQPDIDLPFSDFEEALNDIRAKSLEVFDFSDVPPTIVFRQFHFLLSKGFDLFGLIEAGLAIDATTIK